jgi:hypothetical protein
MVIALRVIGGRYEIEDTLDVGLPPLRIKLVGADARFSRPAPNPQCDIPVEQSRAMTRRAISTVGTFRADLESGVPVALVASVEIGAQSTRCHRRLHSPPNARGAGDSSKLRTRRSRRVWLRLVLPPTSS